MRRLIGYARVSTDKQELRPQMDALMTAGRAEAEISTDKASGFRRGRPGLDACVKALALGDTLVWRQDRLGRSMPHLVGLVEELLRKGIGFQSLSDGAIDTTAAFGRPDVQHLFEPGTVRAPGDPGAHALRPCCDACTG